MSYAYKNKFLQWAAFLADAVFGIFFRKRPFTVPSGAPIKIVVVKLDQLGDCFLSAPVFEHLKGICPQASIDVVCQDNAAPIFENNPFVSGIVPFNYPRMYRGKAPAGMGETFSLIRTLRRKKYDVFIDLRGEPFVAFLGFLSGARNRIGFEKEEVGGFFYTQPLRYDRGAHETERYEKVVASLGGNVVAWKPRIYLTDAEIKSGEQAIDGMPREGYVVVHPGAGVPYKIWPKENFADIIRSMLKDYHFDIVLLGGAGEKDTGEYIEGIAKNQRVKNKIGQWSLRESYFAISRARAFLGNDSALAHFAGALDVPTIDLMNAAVDRDRWRPIGTNSIVISENEKGHRCGYDHCPYPCPNMQAIKTDEVYEKWRLMIGSTACSDMKNIPS